MSIIKSKSHYYKVREVDLAEGVGRRWGVPGEVQAEWVSILNKASGQVSLSKVLKRRRAVVLQVPGVSVGEGAAWEHRDHRGQW